MSVTAVKGPPDSGHAETTVETGGRVGCRDVSNREDVSHGDHRTRSRRSLGQGRRRRSRRVAGHRLQRAQPARRVSAATRDRVERAMADLGFVRNESARQLRMGTSRTLAYVMLDATNPFFTDVAQGIELAAEGADLSLFLCNSNNSADPRGDATWPTCSSSACRASCSPPSTPTPGIDAVAGARCPARHRRPDPRRRAVLLRGRRRRPRRPARRRAPRRPGSPPGRLRRRSGACSDRSATASPGPGRPGPRPGCRPRT